MQKLISIFVILACLGSSGCALVPVYKPDVQQGNVITPEMLVQLKPGLSTSQVRYIMGSPVLINTFSPNRWDYIYTLKPRYGKYQRQAVTLYFVNDRLVQFK